MIRLVHLFISLLPARQAVTAVMMAAVAAFEQRREDRADQLTTQILQLLDGVDGPVAMSSLVNAMTEISDSRNVDKRTIIKVLAKIWLDGTSSPGSSPSTSTAA
jgi:hypothetical protein